MARGHSGRVHGMELAGSSWCKSRSLHCHDQALTLCLPQLRQVPTMGTSIPILAYLSGLRYNRNAKETLLSGYAKVSHCGPYRSLTAVLLTILVASTRIPLVFSKWPCQINGSWSSLGQNNLKK